MALGSDLEHQKNREVRTPQLFTNWVRISNPVKMLKNEKNLLFNITKATLANNIKIVIWVRIISSRFRRLPVRAALGAEVFVSQLTDGAEI
jgi:hypothetical protein